MAVLSGQRMLRMLLQGLFLQDLTDLMDAPATSSSSEPR